MDKIRVLRSTLGLQQRDFKREREDTYGLANKQVEKERSVNKGTMAKMREKTNVVRAAAFREVEDLEENVEVKINRARGYTQRAKAQAELVKEAETETEGLR